jgi:hypothetical protein
MMRPGSPPVSRPVIALNCESGAKARAHLLAWPHARYNARSFQRRSGNRRHTRLLNVLSVFVGVGLLAMVQAATAQDRSGIPRGVFSLGKVGKPADSAALSCAEVDGISIRQAWRNLERTKGNYDWTFLDSEVKRAQEAGKMVLLRVIPEGPPTPRWVLQEGVQTFTFNDHNEFHKDKQGLIAVYWDKTYLAEKKTMIEAVGKHFGSNPAVRIIDAICVSSHGGDWHVPHDPEDVRRWQDLGYTPEKVTDVCKQIIDTTMRSFPKQFVALAVNPSGKLEPKPGYQARTAVQYARQHYPGRLIVQTDQLAAVTPKPGEPDPTKKYELLADSRPDVAGQMLWFSYGDPTCRNGGRHMPCDFEATLRESIDVGLAYGMRYIEIYEEDVLHQPAVIRYAHDRLTK